MVKNVIYKEIIWTILVLSLIGGCGKSCTYLINKKNNEVKQDVYRRSNCNYELITRRRVNNYYKSDTGNYKEIDSIKVFRYYEAIISIDSVKQLQLKPTLK